ncbi:hypothetical protein VE25_02665 [Devosia geojensis]|uniref:Uncharacterized protein n=2 Tax=Devosia geojensis TaxID=443610 RepID=A0A0F5FXS3_9HYPH|nr:hypothetical protein VE25_02665 [Devosia geojensis]
MRRAMFAGCLCLATTMSAVAQQEGWRYSPLPGEGDRATMGCALESDPDEFACLAVRCESDFSVGLYIHTSLGAADIGAWRITVDKEERGFIGQASATGYGARLAGDEAGDLEWLLDGLKQGAAAFLDPGTRASLTRNYIPLDGSLYAINTALAYCAPRLQTG